MRDAEDHGREGGEEQDSGKVGRRQQLDLPPDTKIVRVNSGDEVEQPRDHDKLRTIIRSDELDGALAERKVEQSGADVAREAEHVQRVAGVGHVDLSLHGEPQRKHRSDGDKQQESADPMARQQMSSSGNEPAEDQRRVNEAFTLRLFWGLRLRCHASYDYKRTPKAKYARDRAERAR